MHLREYLYHYNLSISEFARMIDCSRGYISQIKLGHVKPGRKIAKAIENATHGKVSIIELMNPVQLKKSNIVMSEEG